MHLRNRRAKPGEAYDPTLAEHVANVGTHGLAILPAIWGLQILTEAAETRLQYWVACVYGGAIILLFTMSTVYHVVFLWGEYRQLQLVLHMVDRTVIYVFIAASYMPWLMLRDTGPLGGHMRYLVWCFALFGIAYQYLFHEKFKLLETLLYMFIGTIPAIALLNGSEWNGLGMMAMGVVVYVVGVVFFKTDGVVPCAHAIWHIHVVVGAAFHYYAVRIYLIGTNFTVDNSPHDHSTVS